MARPIPSMSSINRFIYFNFTKFYILKRENLSGPLGLEIWYKVDYFVHRMSTLLSDHTRQKIKFVNRFCDKSTR